ncbi:tRNA-specific adenosine deaminase 2-like [Oopsacas minuta]|uniref:tRNA-specific adenosine deaminase 2-like n=1 Tax=Oopsacas minuta TaxID=111878 RepID=A0AAV7K6K1_9METZ|nr:tRNA-specific adenosine deaminase 2-like [Oopsacas minuta]
MAESMPKEHWMWKALELAKQGLDEGEVPVGCVLVKDDKILVSAHNEVGMTKDPTRHAELVALDLLRANLDKACKFRELLSTCTLYVTLEPCVMCSAALRMMGVRKVVYGFSNTRFGGCGSVLDVHSKQFQYSYSSDEQHKPNLTVSRELEVVSGLLGKEALGLLQQFYAQQNPNAPNPAKRVRLTCNELFNEKL